MTTEPGYIVYKGPSELDGKPIVVIATKKTKNPKTGKMLQTWILRDRISPLDALKKHGDKSICGDCVHSKGKKKGKKSCYVNVGQAPSRIWEAFKRGRYSKNTTKLINHVRDKKRSVRLGAYGDPAAIPISYWLKLVETARIWTGYTHQWRNCDQNFRDILMASCDSLADMTRAIAKGWRTFRIIDQVSELVDGEILCPASDEAGKKTTCERCGLCAGMSTPNAKNIAIVIHGRVGISQRNKRIALTIKGK